MIDIDKLNEILTEYKKHFKNRWNNEKYKWQAIKHFQSHWNIEAANFGKMFEYATSKTANLLTSKNFYPREMIINFAKNDDEIVRQMFRRLFNKNEPLSGRIELFQDTSETLRQKYDEGTWKNHYQNIYTISVYLWLMFPDKYYIYKYQIYKDISTELNSDYKPKHNGSVDNLINGFRMYDEICDSIQKDVEMKSMLQNVITDDCYADIYLKTCTIDFGFYFSKFYLKQSQQQNYSLNISDEEWAKFLQDNFTSNLLDETDLYDTPLYSNTTPAIWKISHGKKATGISNQNKILFENRNVVVVSSKTKAKASSNISQGQAFINEIKKGDFFYLCYGNSIQLLGQFISEKAVLNAEIKNGWYERQYRIIAKSKNTSAYTGIKKWWTPNDNSTCIKVKEENLFEELILKPYFDMSLNSLFHNVNEIQKNSVALKYTKKDFLNTVYMTEQRYNMLEALLKNKKNIILQGAPGVGKTFIAKKLAYTIMGEKDDSRIKIVQFHQNYSYEDFIMGYRPCGADFKLTEGIFYHFCKEASKHKNKEYFFIIDEINRGNISKIFGELLMLIEKQYRGTTINLYYSGMPFSVPENLYIIGMMNTADRSLAIMDYALRRRFSFFEIEPAYNSEGFRNYQQKIENKTFNAVIEQIKLLNKEIASDTSLGNGFQIGHSYFCGKKPEECTTDWIYSVVEFDIIPMLSEYWFDETEKLEQWKKSLRGVFDDK